MHSILASDDMLVKQPLTIVQNKILTGFKEKKGKKIFYKK